MPDRDIDLVQRLIDQIDTTHAESLVKFKSLDDNFTAFRTAWDIDKDRRHLEMMETLQRIEKIASGHDLLAVGVADLQKEREEREKKQQEEDDAKKNNRVARFTLFLGAVFTGIITILSAWIIKLSAHPLFASTPKHPH